jgi:hypothetical protein
VEYDEDKVDEYTLALLYLVTHDRHEGYGARAWKGFDWDTLNRLHGKGYISNPIGKAKSIGMTEEGFLKAKELFEGHFGSEAKTASLPKFTPQAKKRWQQIPEWARKELIEAVWCSQCRTGVPMQVREGKMSGGSLPLGGICVKCGSEITRVIEPARK